MNQGRILALCQFMKGACSEPLPPKFVRINEHVRVPWHISLHPLSQMTTNLVES